MKKRLSAAVLVLAALTLQACATPELHKSPETLYREGEQAFRKENYEEAITLWKKVKESYKSPELSAKAEIGIADAYFLNKEYIEAAAAYEDFRKLHPTHDRAGYALFRQGTSYYNQINGIDTDQTPVKNARSIYEQYRKQYPAGPEAVDVLDKIRDCRDKELQYEIYVGRFYLKTDKYEAAIQRFLEAEKRFADMPRMDEVLFYLGKSYYEAGQKEKARETVSRLLKEYPQTMLAEDAGKLLNKVK